MKKWKKILIVLFSTFLILISLNLSLLLSKPNHYEAVKSLNSKAKLLYNQREYESSIKTYYEILDLEPTNDEAYIEIKKVFKTWSLELIEQGNEQEAFEKAKILVDMGITEAPEPFNSGKPVFYLMQSDKYLRNKQPEKAIFLLKQTKGNSFINEEVEQSLFKSYLHLIFSLRFFKSKF